MSCSVAIPNSPIFSLSSSHYFTKNCYIISSSTDSLPTSSSSSHSSPVLKKKRPAKLDIPVASLIVELPPAVPSPSAAKDVVEVEGDGFSVYCKRGSRKHMEDRYSASLDLHGQSKQVTSWVAWICSSFFFFLYYIDLLNKFGKVLLNLWLMGFTKWMHVQGPIYSLRFLFVIGTGFFWHI